MGSGSGRGTRRQIVQQSLKIDTVIGSCILLRIIYPGRLDLDGIFYLARSGDALRDRDKRRRVGVSGIGESEARVDVCALAMLSAR
jgi:hypothetical protein